MRHSGSGNIRAQQAPPLELWHYLKRQSELNAQRRFLHDHMAQQDFDLNLQNQSFEALILHQHELFTEYQVGDPMHELHLRLPSSIPRTFEMVDGSAIRPSGQALISEFPGAALSSNPDTPQAAFAGVAFKNFEAGREMKEVGERERKDGTNFDNECINELELSAMTHMQGSRNPASQFHITPLANQCVKVLKPSEFESLVSETVVTQANSNSCDTNSVGKPSQRLSPPASALLDRPFSSPDLKRRRDVLHGFTPVDSDIPERTSSQITESSESGVRKRRLDRGKCNNWQLRAADGKISALDIVSCVLKIKNKEKARNRLQKYRESDASLNRFQSFVFLENRGRPSLVVSSYEELHMLLKHIRDPGMVAEFLLHYKCILQSHLGHPTLPHDVFNLKAFELLPSIVRGVSGSGSFIASIPSFPAFLKFKRKLELETATHYVQSTKFLRKNFSWIEYRCHRGLNHRKNDKNNKDLFNCPAKLVIRENYLIKSEDLLDPNQDQSQNQIQDLSIRNVIEMQFNEKTNQKKKEKEKNRYKNDKVKIEVSNETIESSKVSAPEIVLDCRMIDCDMNVDAEMGMNDELDIDVDPSLAKSSFFNRGMILEMELCHEGHEIGSAVDLALLPVDERILEKIQQLAISHYPHSNPLSDQDIQKQLEHFASEILKMDELEFISKNDRRFFPDLRFISNEVSLARRISQIKQVDTSLDEIKQFALQCPNRVLPRLIDRLEQVKHSVELAPSTSPNIKQFTSQMVQSPLISYPYHDSPTVTATRLATGTGTESASATETDQRFLSLVKVEGTTGDIKTLARNAKF